ncbi:uncharacterized protein [Apostichopus japonicus]|uniref:uncharacterized protein n=1 Tax=Stichopus japonicus TaxID=307972 RepID=UPI003AB72C98
MSSTKRKQDKPTKSLFVPGSEEPSFKSRGPKTRNQARSRQTTQARRSGRVPKKKVPFSNEIPVPKKRVKRRSDEVILSPTQPSSNRAKILPTKKGQSQKSVPPKKVEQHQILEVYTEATESSTMELPSDTDSDSSEIKIETDSNLESVRLALKDTLESLQTMDDPTINVEIPYFVIKKKKKKKKKAKKKSKSEKKEVTDKPQLQPKFVKVEPDAELEDISKENVLDIDLLRKLSADSLVLKYADHQTVTVPKDKDNDITQSVYTCKMLPSHCFEKFMGIDEDTKHQITRHLLRHVGELLTMANEGMATKESSEGTAHEEDDEAAAFITAAAKKTTYHVASNPKPFTVSHPQNVNLKRSRYTVIRSSEGKEGTNEVVLLPRGRGFYSYRPPEDEPQLDAITEQSFHTVIDNLLGQASIPKVESTAGPSNQSLVTLTNNVVMSGNGSVVVGEVRDGVADVSGVQTSVILLDEKDIQMDVEVSTGARRRRSPISGVPDGVGSIMKMNHTLPESEGTMDSSDQILGNPQEVPYPDHTYSFSDGLATTTIHTNSDGTPTVAPISIEDSSADKLDINPILNSMNEQVSRLIPDIEHPGILPAQNSSIVDQEEQEASTSQATVVDPAATASVASVMTPEEEEMLRVKAVDLLDSLLKNQKKRGPFRCQICHKILTAASTLRAHYRSHAGIKPFQCLLCNATFTRQHSLNYHMMIHNQEARFSCSFCARQFRHANHFREHLRRHTGEEPYGCTDCPARFKTRNTYKRHMRSKHNKIVTHKNNIKLITDDSD